MESKKPGEARGRREEGAIGQPLVQPTRSGTGYDRDIIDTRIPITRITDYYLDHLLITRITDYQDH